MGIFFCLVLVFFKLNLYSVIKGEVQGDLDTVVMAPVQGSSDGQLWEGQQPGCTGTKQSNRKHFPSCPVHGNWEVPQGRG